MGDFKILGREGARTGTDKRGQIRTAKAAGTARANDLKNQVGCHSGKYDKV